MRTLHGLCVSSGNCQGYAHIVEEQKDPFLTYKWNDPTVLIVKTLDRDMLVNLDDNVVGVIAEKGSIGCHGAGILREMGKPCVLRIKNALSTIKEGTEVLLHGNENRIMLVESERSKEKLHSHPKFGMDYFRISKPGFRIKDIKTHNKPVMPRPRRHYQKLRFDIIEGVRGESPAFLFGLPKGSYEQSANGSLIEYNSPVYDDICSFILANPDWYESKARERSYVISEFYARLQQLENAIYESQITALDVFNECADMYRSLYKYVLMSQAISDEMLDYYIDFCSYIVGELYADDVLNLHSDYVQKSLEGGCDPGVSQTWDNSRAVPRIWPGEISYKPIERNDRLLQGIREKSSESNSQLMRDYESFRRVIPLVYELSEEFFFTSSSINSFINWSIKSITDTIQKKHPGFTIQQAYDTSLDNFLRLAVDSAN